MEIDHVFSQEEITELMNSIGLNYMSYRNYSRGGLAPTLRMSGQQTFHCIHIFQIMVDKYCLNNNVIIWVKEEDVSLGHYLSMLKRKIKEELKSIS